MSTSYHTQAFTHRTAQYPVNGISVVNRLTDPCVCQYVIFLPTKQYKTQTTLLHCYTTSLFKGYIEVKSSNDWYITGGSTPHVCTFWFYQQLLLYAHFVKFCICKGECRGEQKQCITALVGEYRIYLFLCNTANMMK